MTAAQFEKEWATERYGVDVATFRQLGFRIVPCNCGNDDCSGWRPSHPEADRADALGDIAHSLNHVAGFFKSLGQIGVTLATGPLADGIRAAMQNAGMKPVEKVQ